METLAERIARDGPVSELDAIGWAIRLAKRLEALHMLGVAHGSVSPACVIAAGQDRNARAYLADVQHTSPSPSYQSPERILGGDISAANDVWALAATLYALLTGQSPFSAGGGNDAEIRQKILAASPPPLAVYDVGDDDLQHILDHAFAREIGRRTASISAFRRALEEWHPNRGVANLPPLEDDDPANEDEEDGARTMLVHDPGGALRHALGNAVPRVNQADDDDDEDDVRTLMRTLPKDDLAAIIARATATADANRAAANAPFPAPAGGPPVTLGEAPRPPVTLGEAPRPPVTLGEAPRPPAQPAPGRFGPVKPMINMPAPHAPRAPAPTQVLPQIADEDSQEIRTVMRTPEQMAVDDAMLHHNGQPPGLVPLGNARERSPTNLLQLPAPSRNGARCRPRAARSPSRRTASPWPGFPRTSPTSPARRARRDPARVHDGCPRPAAATTAAPAGSRWRGSLQPAGACPSGSPRHPCPRRPCQPGSCRGARGAACGLREEGVAPRRADRTGARGGGHLRVPQAQGALRRVSAPGGRGWRASPRRWW